MQSNVVAVTRRITDPRHRVKQSGHSRRASRNYGYYLNREFRSESIVELCGPTADFIMMGRSESFLFNLFVCSYRDQSGVLPGTSSV